MATDDSFLRARPKSTLLPEFGKPAAARQTVVDMPGATEPEPSALDDIASLPQPGSAYDAAHARASNVILLALQFLSGRHQPAVDLRGDDALTRQLGRDLVRRHRPQPVEQGNSLQFPLREDRELLAEMGQGIGHRLGRRYRRAGGSLMAINRRPIDRLQCPPLPPETYQYRLGLRSALEWVIDQYRPGDDTRTGIASDPYHDDDPESVVRLIGQVVKVSVDTVRLVTALPEFR